MKQGKVFGKLAQDKRVRTINLREETATVYLSEGFYAIDHSGRGIKHITIKTAREANLFIKSAIKVPTPREGYEIVFNMMSGLPVEQAVGTPHCCDVSSERYWSM